MIIWISRGTQVAPYLEEDSLVRRFFFDKFIFCCSKTCLHFFIYFLQVSNSCPNPSFHVLLTVFCASHHVSVTSGKSLSSCAPHSCPASVLFSAVTLPGLCDSVSPLSRRFPLKEKRQRSEKSFACSYLFFPIFKVFLSPSCSPGKSENDAGELHQTFLPGDRPLRRNESLIRPSCSSNQTNVSPAAD